MATLGLDGLIGRERELDAVRALVEATAGGASATVLVEGEAGIGKTRLLHCLLDLAADRGLTTLRGAGHPLEQTRPFGPFAHALDLRLRSTDPRRAELASLLVGGGPGDARFRVVDEIVDLVDASAHGAGVVVVVDDLHWADDSSLLAFRALSHGLTSAPLLLAGTLRPTPRSRGLDQLLDECVLSGAGLLQLGSLSPDGTMALVEAELGGPPGPALSAIAAKAGGNPLWLVELLRSLSSEGWLRSEGGVVDATGDELPGSLRDLVLRRLQYLPPTTLDVLQVASVLGDAVSIHELSAVVRLPAPELVARLAEAFRARLLDEHDDAVAFRHQLVQDAIYQDLPIAVRRALHRDAARALVGAGADLSTVASHLVRGADRGDLEAVRWLRQAAIEAAAGGPSTAVELLRHGVALLPEGHVDADAVSVELAEALLRAGRVAEASQLAATILDRPHRPESDVPARLTLVSALSLQNDAAELTHRTEAALRSAALDPADQALVLTQASYGRTFAGDFVGGEATARRALELGERIGSAPMTVWSLGALSVAVRTQGRYLEALALGRRAVALVVDGPEAARLRHPHFFLAMALADCDLLGEARAAFAHAIDECETLGSAWLLPDMLHLSGELRFTVGDWDDAAAEIESALRLGAEHGQRISIPQSRAYLALMASARGDHAAAVAALESVEGELEAAAPAYGGEVVALAAAAIAEAEGKPEEADDLLRRFWQLDVERGVHLYDRALAPALVRLSTVLGHRDVARAVTDRAEAGVALAPEVPSIRGAAARCRGLVDGDPAPLLAAVALTRRSGRLLDHAGTCEDAGRLLAAIGRSGEAKPLLLEAQDGYESIGARAWSARVGADLRRLGVRQGARGSRLRAATGWASLTASEGAVTELVAAGLTNREVARRLHISPHTVNTHLRHIFQKLSVSTRSELAAMRARDHAGG